MSIYLGDIPLAHNAVSRNIGEIIQSTIPLSDAGLHLLDGALISSAGSYAKFINYIAGLVSNYPDLFTTETNWQSSVSTYGVCGKFVYDSVNNTVRLPKITGFTEGATDPTALGDLVEAGLPNITGYGDHVGGPSSEYGGAFEKTGNSNFSKIGGDTYFFTNFNFDASRSSPIYGNSSTVQPQAIKVLYYIVVANSVKTNIEVDIDEIATDLNGKADVDLSNVNASGTALASGWSMPSSRYIDLTPSATGSTYTAPANGWFEVWVQGGTTSNNKYLEITNNATGISQGVYGTSNYNFKCHLPVKKGDIVAINYNNMQSVPNKCRFIYAEGEN